MYEAEVTSSSSLDFLLAHDSRQAPSGHYEQLKTELQWVCGGKFDGKAHDSHAIFGWRQTLLFWQLVKN